MEESTTTTTTTTTSTMEVTGTDTVLAMEVDDEKKAMREENDESPSKSKMLSVKDDDDNNNDDDDDNNDDDNDDTHDDDDEEDEEYDNDDNDNQGISPAEAERLLLAAAGLKEQGNIHFAKASRDEAARCYRRALHRLKKLRRGPRTAMDDLDPQVVALWTTLSTNLATVLWQQGKFQAAVSAATQALDLQPMHVKALYRRAVAHRKLGNAEQAIQDLKTALTVEPTHGACRKELRATQQSLQRATAQQKKALSKAFRSNMSLYDDKQPTTTQPTTTITQPTKEQLEATLQAQKKQWEDECVSRMAKGNEAISFQEWQTQQVEEEKEKEKQEAERQAQIKREKTKAAAAAAAQNQQKKDSTTNTNSNHCESDSDDELTEAEWKALRGYKKTKDGRTTSYFTRELDPTEQAILAEAQQGPRKLSTITSVTSDAAGMTPTATSTDAVQVKKGPSAWNRAGTWEERDTSEWCRERLQERLKQVSTGQSSIVKVDSLTGDASVVWTKGTQRYVFDFHATLHYKWTPEATQDSTEDEQTKPLPSSSSSSKQAKGVVRLPDISSTQKLDEELEVLFEGWKRQPANLQAALADRPALAQALRAAVQAWLQDFHQQYQADH